MATKRQHPSASFFLVSALTGTLLLSPLLLLYRDTLWHVVIPRAWMWLAATGFFLALYYVSLAGAYRSGEMSVAYPLARSSPVIVVTIVALLLGRSDQVSGLCVTGVILVVGGCFLIPLHRFNDLHVKKYFTPTCGLALLAAVGTAGYSILDDEALRMLRTDPGMPLNTTQITLMYACLQAAMGSLWLVLFIAIRPAGRSDLRQVLRTKKGQAILTGLSIHLAYSMVLVSLAFARNVSYVVGFRQLSIPLGAMLGIVALKEAPHIPKLTGILVMFAGLMLIAMG